MALAPTVRAAAGACLLMHSPLSALSAFNAGSTTLAPCVAAAASSSYSTQYGESSQVASHASRSQPVDEPVITGDTSTGPGQHVSDGRSSQTTSTTVAGEEARALVAQVLQVYEARSLEQQRRLISELYSPDAIYENNVTLLSGREAILKRFALLPVCTSSVRVEYDNPVVLGATTSAPEALDDLAHKGDLQVEVTNKQHYRFDRAHSLWRSILLPQGDPDLSVLTRLTLTQSKPHKVLYHRDMWMNSHSQWWAPLQRCWGVMEQAAPQQPAAAAVVLLAHTHERQLMCV